MSTKSLAKELGLIRKRSQSCSEAQQPQSVRKQHFSYLIIIDFESTCWREKNNLGQEIIEFPAVLLNSLNGEIESEFHTFVQPQEHPVLSEFCTELTGITQEQVESAPPLQICLSRFLRWLHTLQQEKGVVFETDSKCSSPCAHPCAFITWSDWDLGVCLLYECKRKQISVPEALKSWIDLRATYRVSLDVVDVCQLFYNRKPKGLRGALQDLGIQFTGREHSGLVDARNTALLAWRMLADGCVLTVTKSLRRALVKSRPVSRNSSAERSARLSAVCERTEPQTSVCEVLISPHTLLSSTTALLCVSRSKPLGNLQNVPLNTTLAGLTDTTYDPETPEACWRDGVLLTEEEEPGSYDDVILGVEPEAVAPSAVDSYSVNSDALQRTRISEHESSEKPWIQSHCTREPDRTTSNSSRPASSSSASAQLFKTPKLLSHTDPYTSVSRFLGRKSAPFSVYKDPPTHPPSCTSVPRPPRPPLSATVNHLARRTSPLCGCGRRARRLTVGNGGPNHGRVFYCCPVRRQGCGGPQKGCEFFQWESGLISTSRQNLLRTPKTCSARSVR